MFPLGSWKGRQKCTGKVRMNCLHIQGQSWWHLNMFGPYPLNIIEQPVCKVMVPFQLPCRGVGEFMSQLFTWYIYIYVCIYIYTLSYYIIFYILFNLFQLFSRLVERSLWLDFNSEKLVLPPFLIPMMVCSSLFWILLIFAHFQFAGVRE